MISVIADDAFDGLENLQMLSLKENNLRQVHFTAFPSNLTTLELEFNQLNEMPTFEQDITATNLRSLYVCSRCSWCLWMLMGRIFCRNLSHNWLWRLETGSQFHPYPSLLEL